MCKEGTQKKKGILKPVCEKIEANQREQQQQLQQSHNSGNGDGGGGSSGGTTAEAAHGRNGSTPYNIKLKALIYEIKTYTRTLARYGL